MKIDFKSSLDKIKGKVTFNQVLESYGVKTSHAKLIPCPLHSETKGSFKIYNGDSGDGSFWCFGCLKGGDMLSFVEYFEGVSKWEALQSLATKFKVDVSTREYSNDLLGAVEGMLKPRSKPNEIVGFLKAKADSNAYFNHLSADQPTPYMLKKKVPHLGTRHINDVLVVPVRDVNDAIWSLQYIYPDGSKIFYPGSNLKGGMLRLGPEPPVNPENTVYLSEGYATAASVHLSSGCPVYVCFSTGNIPRVYNILKEYHPDWDIVVAGDNDRSGKANDLPSVYPETPGQDWNDVWVLEGPDAVLRGLSRSRQVTGDKGLACRVASRLKHLGR